MDIPKKGCVAVRAFAALAALSWVLFVLHAGVGLGGSRLDGFFNAWVYNGLVLTAALACFGRAAFVSEARAAWLVVGAAILAWTGGEIYWSLAVSSPDEPPFPSPADALYLTFYPASYVGLLLLVRARVHGFPRSQWLDGGIAALAIAALAAALAFEPIVAGTTGDAATVATNLAYPLGDLMRDELVLHYQPIVGLRTGKLVGVEALLRWRHPTRGILLPTEFIPVAEATRVMPIGSWVLAEACRQAAAWQALHPALAMGVNVSSVQLGQSSLRDELSTCSKRRDSIRAA